jgi:simple sugar transport system ATP-binding protein
MGDNGAGKSTLVKIIAGNFPATLGTMHIGGKQVTFHKPIEARQEGVEIVYQDLALCGNLTAAGNVFLSREVSRGFGPFRILDYGAMYKRAGELFKELKSETRPRDLVKQMSGGQRQAVAIGRAIYWQANVLIMDEPTAALGVPEQRKVRELILRLKDQQVGVIFISHNLQDIFAVSDRILVLHRGVAAGERQIDQTNHDEIVKLMVGGGVATS